MEKCGCAEYLCDRAEAPVFIFVAYFSALLPLAVVYTLDFITEKWKSISATRREGRWHLFASVFLFTVPGLLHSFAALHRELYGGWRRDHRDISFLFPNGAYSLGSCSTRSIQVLERPRFVHNDANWLSSTVRCLCGGSG